MLLGVRVHTAVVEGYVCFVRYLLAGARVRDVEPVPVAGPARERGVGVPTVAVVAAAARDTDSIHRGATASVQIAGNGYQVQLPGCKDAGFTEGDRAPAVPGEGILLVHDGSQRRLVEDLKQLRQAQVS